MRRPGRPGLLKTKISGLSESGSGLPISRVNHRGHRGRQRNCNFGLGCLFFAQSIVKCSGTEDPAGAAGPAKPRKPLRYSAFSAVVSQFFERRGRRVTRRDWLLGSERYICAGGGWKFRGTRNQIGTHWLRMPITLCTSVSSVVKKIGYHRGHRGTQSNCDFGWGCIVCLEHLELLRRRRTRRCGLARQAQKTSALLCVLCGSQSVF